MVTALRNEGFRVRFIDMRTKSSLITKFGVRRNPTFVYVVNGEEVRRATGKLPLGTVRNMYRLPMF